MLIARILMGALRASRRPVWPAPVSPEDGPTLDCPLCRSRFACPMDWGIADDDHWWVLSRCGECGVWSELLITNAQAARLDCELDRHQAAIRRAAERLEGERMAAQAEAFISALERDLIDAGDFA